jgi:hypothetical protein
LTSCIDEIEKEERKEDYNCEDKFLCNTLESSLDPPNYAAAMKTEAAEQWKTGIESELKNLRDNRT